MNSSIFSSDARAVVRRSVGAALGAVVLVVISGAVLKRSNPALAAWNLGEAEIVFVGTSHTNSGIDRMPFERPIGIVSFRGLDHQLAAAAMARHEHRWPRMARAVLEVDEFTLLTDMTQMSRDTPLELLARLDLSIGDLPPAAVRGALWRARTVLSGNGTAALDPSVRFTAKRLFYQPSPREHRPLTRSAGELRVAYLGRIAAGRPADNIDALVNMSGRLAARGVRVALMSFPQHAYYRAARPAEWDVTMEQALQAVRDSVGNVEYWDFRSDSRFVDDDFANVDHLSAAGAVKLSSFVATRLSRSHEAAANRAEARLQALQRRQ